MKREERDFYSSSCTRLQSSLSSPQSCSSLYTGTSPPTIPPCLGNSTYPWHRLSLTPLCGRSQPFLLTHPRLFEHPLHGTLSGTLGWDLRDIYSPTVFPYDLSCLILIPVTTCLQVLPPTPTPLGAPTLSAYQRWPYPFIPISPDYSCLTAVYLQEPFLPPCIQPPVAPPLGVASIPSVLSFSQPLSVHSGCLV